MRRPVIRKNSGILLDCIPDESLPEESDHMNIRSAGFGTIANWLCRINRFFRSMDVVAEKKIRLSECIRNRIKTQATRAG